MTLDERDVPELRAGLFRELSRLLAELESKMEKFDDKTRLEAVSYLTSDRSPCSFEALRCISVMDDIKMANDAIKNFCEIPF